MLPLPQAGEGWGEGGVGMAKIAVGPRTFTRPSGTLSRARARG